MRKNKTNLKFTRNKLVILSLIVSIILTHSNFLISNQVATNTVYAAETSSKTYTLKTTTKPYKNKYTTYSTYNKYTKHYYVLRSYLEQLETLGGGTLVLQKGTYTITNTLYIPSNVTLKLSNGVIIQKGSKTRTTKLTPSKSLFQLVAPIKSSKKASSVKYNGASNINIIGEGKATIDLKYAKDTVGFVIGHNNDVVIKGITFQKMYGGSFIRMAASKDVVIQDNIFQLHKDSKENSQEAISLDVADGAVSGFNFSWSKNDKTVNKNITIENNEFTDLERALGSTKFTEGKYQSNIQVLNNTINTTDSHALRILNWDKTVVKGNTFTDITNSAGNLKCILISGAKSPTIRSNTFAESDRPIQIMPWRITYNGKHSAITYNVISDENKDDMLNNTLIDMKEYYVRYNKTYNEYTKDTEKWEFVDTSSSDYVISPSSEPFQNYFINFSTYNSKTKQYYTLRSYLEQLERIGGGTLTLKAGTYVITNTLYVPSNVTLKFQDGVIIKKGSDTGIADFDIARSIFQLVTPSKSDVAGAYGGYEGETNIHFIGTGTVVFDMNYVQDSLGIIFAHNTNVKISGITFKNMYSGHFIELDASKNVTIENNTFTGFKRSESGMKEAINLDTPDKKTGGFNSIWTKFDCTPNKDIVIQNNVFDKLERAIGTHKYSEGKYHDNVQILNNKISNIQTDAIRIMNWTNPVIKGNEIKVVVGNGDRAILASGVKNPTIMNNTFSDVPRPIQVMPWKNSDSGSEYAVTYNEISQTNIDNMLKNKLVRVGETFIRINKTYNVFDRDTDKYYYSGENVSY
jgi:hypothetical protein